MPTKSNYSRHSERENKKYGWSSWRTRVEMIFMETGRVAEAARPRGEFVSIPRKTTARSSAVTDKRVSSFNLQRQISGSWVIRIRVTSILSRFPYIDDITRQIAALQPRNLNQFLRKPAATRWAP